MRHILLFVLCVGFLSETAQAQTAQTVPAPQSGWDVTVYPIPIWVPLGIRLKVDVPAGDGGDAVSGDILESRFDGAFFGGVHATNGPWRIEGSGLWVAVGGDRPERPFIDVDLDVIYGDAKFGRRFAPHWWVTAGVRRIAVKYDIRLADRPNVSGKPGVWDPLVGLIWHRVGRKAEWSAFVDGGGFGVGSDADISGGGRFDWKFARHFGLTAGYHAQYLKLSHPITNGTVVVRATVHGPAVGLGLYF